MDPVEVKPMEPGPGERQHLLLQENAPPDMTGYILCAACVFFLANPLFGLLAFILAGKPRFHAVFSLLGLDLSLFS